MIRFSSEKVKILHHLMAQATGNDVVRLGLGVADGSMQYEEILTCMRDHKV